MRQLNDEQLWRLVFPAYDRGSGGLAANSLLCTGEGAFTDTAFAGARPVRGWPLQPEPGDLTFGTGPKRIKIVWFKTHAWDDGTVGGVLSLVRADEEFAEVYGVGTYKGSARNSRFATERLGGTLVVTATDDGCSGKAIKEPCTSWLHVLVPWHGRLREQVTVATERREQVEGGEPASLGPVTYRLTAAPLFETSRIRVLEQVQAIDESERKLRAAELERQFDFVNGQLVERQPSLWEKVVGRQRVDSSSSTSTAKPALLDESGKPESAVGAFQAPTDPKK